MPRLIIRLKALEHVSSPFEGDHAAKVKLRLVCISWRPCHSIVGIWACRLQYALPWTESSKRLWLNPSASSVPSKAENPGRPSTDLIAVVSFIVPLLSSSAISGASDKTTSIRPQDHASPTFASRRCSEVDRR